MARRPAHKLAHQPCPFGQFNWSDCDVASEHRFGHCKATVGKYEPADCTRWAFDEGGYCTQHYVSRVDADRAAAKAAIVKAELDARIEAYIAMTAEHPSIHWRESENVPFRLTELE